jgi:ATP-dependent Clp protease ATP-binding subunit ClpC
MFEHFTSEAIRVIMLAQEEARRLGHNFVGTEQILLGLMGEGSGVAAKVLTELGVTLKDARREVEKIIGRGSGFVPPEIPFTPKVKSLFEQSFREAHNLGHNYVNTEHLLLGLTEAGEGVAAKVLQNLGVQLRQVRSAVMQRLGEEEPVLAGGRGGQKRHQALSMEEYGRNLTKLAVSGRLDPVIGRDKEIERTIQILGRRTKNNPVLIGEPGVGKTAIAEGIAQRIINQDVPEILLGKQVISLDMGLLVAGTRFRGDFEERLKKVVEEIRSVGNVILVIDEIHTLVGAGGTEGGLDAANILKPALARGELQCIGATTLDEYRQYIERDAALERRFQSILVGEPSVEETVQILKGLRSAYEQHHQVIIADTALVAAAELADRYISDRFLPDKAIDLIDEAGSRVRLRHSSTSTNKELKRELFGVNQSKQEAIRVQDFGKASKLREEELGLQKQIHIEIDQEQLSKAPIVDEEDIAQIVASWTGVPVNKLTESESELLLHLEDTLHKRLIGQEQAVTAVSRAMRRARVGLKSQSRPIASFIFSGPTGVGKTELAKALAAYFFGSEEAMIRLDMSEYMESHNISKMIGSPPGYVGYDGGGQLTEAVRRKPYTVLLFDEIEKAHPDIFNVLLQILDEGHLTDAKGRKVDFKNTLIILTSNIGSKVISKGGLSLGFEFDNQDDASYQRIRNRVNEELKAYFRPEFLNRVDDIIVFTQLNKEEIKQIAEIMLRDVASRLVEKGITLQVTDRFQNRVIQEGYDPSYGARPLRRAIVRLLEDNLAEAILSGQIAEGDIAIVDVDDDNQIQVSKSETRELLLTNH